VTITVTAKEIVEPLKSLLKGNEMNKIIAALIAGLFAVSVNAFAADVKADATKAATDAAKPVATKAAADAAKPAADAKAAVDAAKPAADASMEKPATPAPKKAHKTHKKAAPKTEAAKPVEAAPAAK
jgi:hypothetical protein